MFCLHLQHCNGAVTAVVVVGPPASALDMFIRKFVSVCVRVLRVCVCVHDI